MRAGGSGGAALGPGVAALPQGQPRPRRPATWLRGPGRLGGGAGGSSRPGVGGSRAGSRWAPGPGRRESSARPRCPGGGRARPAPYGAGTPPPRPPRASILAWGGEAGPGGLREDSGMGGSPRPPAPPGPRCERCRARPAAGWRERWEGAAGPPCDSPFSPQTLDFPTSSSK